jgi:hypothetical protein
LDNHCVLDHTSWVWGRVPACITCEVDAVELKPAARMSLSRWRIEYP